MAALTFLEKVGIGVEDPLDADPRTLWRVGLCGTVLEQILGHSRCIQVPIRRCLQPPERPVAARFSCALEIGHDLRQIDVLPGPCGSR